jgi:hypothetical protein
MNRRGLIRQGLEAILRSTAGEPEAEGPAPLQPEPKRHTSVYLYPSEFELLEEILFRLRREHKVRIKKSDLWRALLHMAGQMLKNSQQAQELAAACAQVGERAGWMEQAEEEAADTVQ